MAKVDWETSESDEFRIIQSMERILEQHQQELLVKLETWADRVAAPSAPRFLVSKRSGQSKLCDEALPEPSLMHHKNKSYDEARLTHVQVVEATQGLGKFNEDERDAIKDTSLWQSLRQWSRELMGSMPASLFFAGLIVTNSIFLGVQLEMQAASENIFVEDTFFLALNVVYAVLFTMEVMLRLLGSGCSMFIWSSHDWAWNCLDLFVVVSSWVELLLHSLEGNSSISGNRNLRMLRLLRFGRLVRVVRVVRVARLFRSLRTLINSLVGTLKSLFWSLLLLALIMYMFGIMFTDAVLDHRNSLGFTDAGSDLSLRFGSLYLSIETLFRAISNGLTWGEAADALARMDHGMFWCSLFHFYVAFCSFAALNVMTGTFCNAAIKAAERDHDMLVLSLVQTRQELREQVATLFHKIDQRGVGQVTIDDFEQHFSDDVVIAFFESLEIGAMDAWTLFLSLDVDGDHTISVDEFTERCLQLHGPARSADIFALRQNTDKLADYLIKVEGRQLQLHQRFNELLRTMSSVGYLTEPVKEAEL